MTVYSEDLGARARATLELARKLYPSHPHVPQRERTAGYQRLINSLPTKKATTFSETHSGYYGACNPLILAVGWTRGGAKKSYPPPEERLDIGVPGYGREHDYIAAFQEIGAELLLALRGTRTDLADITIADARTFGAASILYANATPECLGANEPKFRAPAAPYKPMFQSVLDATAPLVIIAAGQDAVRFLHEAYPSVRALPERSWIPIKRDGSPGIGFTRREGLIKVAGKPTAYLELPFHPSYGARHAPFKKQAIATTVRLTSEALALREGGSHHLPTATLH